MGVLVAILVLLSWAATLVWLLEQGVQSLLVTPVWLFLAVLLRTFLTTGLFITAHDAMHRSVSRNRRLNDLIGALATFLFAGMSYHRLVLNHGKHHAHPASHGDPDYYDESPRFWRWFFSFMKRYTTLSQVLVMAGLYNVLRLRYDDITLWSFWAGPALLASLQLFTFGTYLPHRPPHDDALGPHRARTLPRNHALAMITCYFFGYHREHHEAPATPWWLLYRSKRKTVIEAGVGDATHAGHA